MTFPRNDAEVDVSDTLAAFKWRPAAAQAQDPVVSYELNVRPAFGYEVEDVARKYQTLPVTEQLGSPGLPLARVNGSGVFLWSVRAVTASGQRGPASSTQWLELRFPKILLAPQLMKPRLSDRVKINSIIITSF